MSGEAGFGFGALAAIALAPVIIPVGLGIAAVGVAAKAGAEKYREYESMKRDMAEKYHLTQETIEELDRMIDSVVSSKRALSESIASTMALRKEGRTTTRSFGEIALEVERGLDFDLLAENYGKAIENSSTSVAGSKDLSPSFLQDLKTLTESKSSPQEYLDALELRISALVATTATERGEQDRLLAEIASARASGASTDTLREMLAPQVEGICKSLDEAHTSQRIETYLDYLTMCSLCHTEPRDISYEKMTFAIKELGESLTRTSLAGLAMRDMNEALEAAGLSQAGITSFDEEEGMLIVDKDGGSCAMVMQHEDDGSFVFTTVADSNPKHVGTEEKARIKRDALKLCDKQRRVRDYLLEKGYNEDEIDFWAEPLSLDYISENEDFKSSKKAQASESGLSTSNSNDEEEMA